MNFSESLVIMLEVNYYIGLSNTSGAKGAIIYSSGTFTSVILAHFLCKEDKMTSSKDWDVHWDKFNADWGWNGWILFKKNNISKVAMYHSLLPFFGAILTGICLGDSIWSIKTIVAIVAVSFGIYVVNRKSVL